MDYPYANGVLKAIEERLLDPARATKIARAGKAGFLKALADAGYGEIGADDTVEDAVEREMKSFHARLDELSPDRKATDLFFLAEDATNVKILFKRRLFGAPAFENAAADGTFAFPGLAKAILEDDPSDLPPGVAAVVAAIQAGTTGVTAGELSAVVDRELYRHALRMAGALANPALRVYLAARIDFANVLSALRMKRLGWESGRLEEVFVPGGKFRLEDVGAVFLANAADASRPLREHYDDKVADIVRDMNEKKSLADIETRFADLLIATVEPYRFDGFSIGPIIYYYLEKKREADLIRTLYARAANDRPAV
jgi:vacuolar-type H+-ATPase subunit C/Vma6